MRGACLSQSPGLLCSQSNGAPPRGSCSISSSSAPAFAGFMVRAPARSPRGLSASKRPLLWLAAPQPTGGKGGQCPWLLLGKWWPDQARKLRAIAVPCRPEAGALMGRNPTKGIVAPRARSPCILSGNDAPLLKRQNSLGAVGNGQAMLAGVKDGWKTRESGESRNSKERAGKARRGG